jgi:hypothetical protein
LKHENGDNGLNGDIAEFYSREFGISLDWLQNGRLPSGLGQAIDASIRNVVSNPENYINQVEKWVARQPEDASVIPLKTGRPPLRIVKIAEYRWSDLEENGADVKRTVPFGLVTTPTSASADDIAELPILSVFVDKPDGQLQRYSRVFILADGEAPEAEYLIFNGRRLGVFPLERGQAWKIEGKIVGRVVGKVESLAPERDR